MRIREEKLVPSLGNFCALGRAQKFTLIIAVSRILSKRKISLQRQKSTTLRYNKKSLSRVSHLIVSMSHKEYNKYSIYHNSIILPIRMKMDSPYETMRRWDVLSIHYYHNNKTNTGATFVAPVSPISSHRGSLHSLPHMSYRSADSIIVFISLSYTIYSAETEWCLSS